MRTSVSDPSRIATVNAGSGLGAIGLTLCPGKKQRDALTGAWDRDLALDLDAVRNWGAAGRRHAAGALRARAAARARAWAERSRAGTCPGFICRLPTDRRPTSVSSVRGPRPARHCAQFYVVHSLEPALWCVDRTADFKTAILSAANLGGDADTTAAVAGQLAGALYGNACIPQRSLERLAGRERIEERAATLFKQSTA